VTQYAPPQPPSLNYAPPVRNDIRTIAFRQKILMYCILAYLALIIARVFMMVNTGGAVPLPLSLLLGLATLGVALTATVFVFMLSIALYNTGMGVLLGILALVPLLGLIILLIVNGKATTVLKQHGVKVGLMGARMSDIPEAPIGR
jgi:hypothetical protein